MDIFSWCVVIGTIMSASTVYSGVCVCVCVCVCNITAADIIAGEATPTSAPQT